MVKVTFRSWKEVVIHEAIENESLSEFIEQKISGIPKGLPIEPMVWANGLLFVRNPMPPTADVIREQLRGIIHYSAVEYVRMDKYEKAITHNGVTVPIINVTKTEALRDVAKALKKIKMKKRKD